MSVRTLNMRKSLKLSVACKKCGREIVIGDCVITRSQMPHGTSIYHEECWEACFV